MIFFVSANQIDIAISKLIFPVVRGVLYFYRVRTKASVISIFRFYEYKSIEFCKQDIFDGILTL